MVGLLVGLILALLAGVGIYAKIRPCWPWQTEGTFAGGTTCDGHSARFDTD